MYPNRELLIVADGEDVRDLLPHDLSVRLIHIESGYNIGEKRNFGVSQARGEFIAHWDDDDWSDPVRLERQIKFAIESGKSVVGFHSMYFTDFRRWWQFQRSQPYAIGSSLLYRKDWWEKYPFPALQIGEDGEFVKYAANANQLASVDAGLLMAATIHPGNTSPRQLTEAGWTYLPDFPGIEGM